MADSHFIEFKGSKVHYLKFGNGPAAMVAIHGFADSAKLFLKIHPALENLYTVYALDVPYHGKTDWTHSELFEPKDIADIIKIIMENESFEEFSLMGYSMGGKIALSIIEDFGTELNELILIASDGLKTHPIYDITAYPGFGRKIFSWFVRQPNIFFRFLSFSRRLGFISNFLYQFARNHTETYERRLRLYNLWVSLADICPEPYDIKQILNKNKIKVHLFFGERDEVIPPAAGVYFKTGLDYSTFSILPMGHLMIKEELITPLSKALNTIW